MKFTLTFEGALMTGGAKADRKHQRRRLFHAQLKRLWSVNSLLSAWHLPINQREAAPAISVLAKDHAKFGGFEFVPLISKQLAVEAALNFHILRPTTFRGQNADPDNIVKIIIDSLKMPQTADELPNLAQPQEDETPFFVLMQDDSLLSKITSVSDELLQPILGKTQIDRSDTRILVDVYIRPNFPTNTNLIFFSDDFEIWNHQWAGSSFDDIRGWSNAELKSRTTQCVLRMRVTSSNFRMQRSAMRPRFRPPEMSEEDRTKQWREDSDAISDQSNEQYVIWNSRLRPMAVALKGELMRRIYGEGPYPEGDHDMFAIDMGVLAGVDPIADAAAGLESLIRQLP